MTPTSATRADGSPPVGSPSGLASSELPSAAPPTLLAAHPPSSHSRWTEERGPATCGPRTQKLVTPTLYGAPDLTDDNRDDLSAVGAMVAGDCPDDRRLDERFIELNDISEPVATAGTWVLLRRGFLTVEGRRPECCLLAADRTKKPSPRRGWVSDRDYSAAMTRTTSLSAWPRAQRDREVGRS